MRTLSIAIAFGLVSVAHASAQQQPDTFRLRELVVTATRLPTRISDAPGTVTVLTADDLRARGVRYVTEALRLVPGVAVAQSGGPGSLTSLFIRGGEADYVQVLVDGVQVNDPGGTYNWAHLRTEDVDRIEIVRGPVSVLYGSDAVSGVVQIFTRAGGPPRLEINATGGRGDKREPGINNTYRTDAVDALLAGSTSTGGVSLRYGGSYARHETNGLYAFNSNYDNTNLSARVGAYAQRADLAFTVRRTESEFHYPTSGSGAVVDRNQFFTGESLVLGADAGVRVHRALELRLLATSHENDTRTDNPEDEAGDGFFWNTSQIERRSLDARLNAQLARNVVATLGAEHERQHGVTAFESVSPFGTFTDDTDERRRNTGVYAQLHGSVISRLTATLGARLDDNDAFGTFRTGRAALNWQPHDATRVHAALGSAFKEPTFFENFAAGFARGNAELEPESSRSWEAGAEHTLADGKLTFCATWFDQRFRNLIQYTGTPPSPNAPNYFNVGAATARGAELTVRADLPHVTVSGSYTHTRTRVTEAGFGGDRAFEDGSPLLRRPRHQASASAHFALMSALQANVDVLHFGARDDLDFTNPAEFQGVRVELPSYTTVDIALEYGVLQRARAGFDVTLRVRNALDEQYQEIYNYPAPGRVVQAGVRARFGF